MKMKEYAKLIVEIAKKYPEAEAMYSSDDEGNRFSFVHYHPTHMEEVNGREMDAVCVN